MISLVYTADSGDRAAGRADAIEALLVQLAALSTAVGRRYGSDDELSQLALRLIDCAAGIVAGLPGGDPDAAQQALDSARESVAAATFTLRRIDNRSRNVRA